MGNVQCVPADMIRLGDASRQKECCLWFQPANHMNGKNQAKAGEQSPAKDQKASQELISFRAAADYRYSICH